jgi:hypothetical protein
MEYFPLVFRKAFRWVVPCLGLIWFLFIELSAESLIGISLFNLKYPLLIFPMLGLLFFFNGALPEKAPWAVALTAILVIWVTQQLWGDELGLFFVMGAQLPQPPLLILTQGVLYSLSLYLLTGPRKTADVARLTEVWELVPGLTKKSYFSGVVELTDEARRMRFVSYVALSLIGVLIILAGLVFLFAGSITSLDLRSDSLVTSISDEIDMIEGKIVDGNEEILFTLKRTAVANGLMGACSSPEQTTETENGEETGSNDELPTPSVESDLGNPMVIEFDPIHDIQCEDVDWVLKEDEERQLAARNRVVGLTQRLTKLQTDLDKARREVFLDEKRQSEIAPLVASAVTRFGVVIILMFFVQSLSNLYRYTLRLSSLYKARSIALLISEEDSERLEKVNKFLSTDGVGYGREPRTLSDEAKKLIDTIGKHYAASAKAQQGEPKQQQ